MPRPFFFLPSPRSLYPSSTLSLFHSRIRSADRYPPSLPLPSCPIDTRLSKSTRIVFHANFWCEHVRATLLFFSFFFLFFFIFTFFIYSHSSYNDPWWREEREESTMMILFPSWLIFLKRWNEKWGRFYLTLFGIN